jgi:hypothetical protein
MAITSALNFFISMSPVEELRGAIQNISPKWQQSATTSSAEQADF